MNFYEKMLSFQPIIFTRGRLHDQITLNQFPEWLQQLTKLFVYPEEYDEHNAKYGYMCQVIKCPDDVRGIAKRREYAAKYLNNNAIQWQLDDDLTFCKAKPDGQDGTWPFLKFTAMQDDTDWENLIDDIMTACDSGFWVGGLGQRISPAGIADFPFSVNSRVYTNTWFDFRKINPERFDWIGRAWKEDEFLPEDFHIQCQMVMKGIPVINMNKWASAGNKTQAAGGCATTRTLENHNKGMIRFADEWSNCTTLRWKDSWVKDKKKAALTIRLGKLYKQDKATLLKHEDRLRVKLGGKPKAEAKELQKKANILREELRESESRSRSYAEASHEIRKELV